MNPVLVGVANNSFRSINGTESVVGCSTGGVALAYFVHTCIGNGPFFDLCV